MPNTAAKTVKNSDPSSSPLRGRMVRVLTPDELHQDMMEFGREVAKTKESAVAFLKRAGIVDDSGQLAEPFRTP